MFLFVWLVGLGLRMCGWAEAALRAAKPYPSFLPPRSIPGYHGLPWWLSGKRICLQCRAHRLNSWVRKIPWRRKWQPTPVFLPGKSQGQRSLAGYSPWGHKSVRHGLTTKQQQRCSHQESQCTEVWLYIVLDWQIWK